MGAKSLVIEHMDVLEHKEQYPRLYKLHLKHHSVPSTSAAMERCFSAAGYIASARRSSLSDDMLEAMLIAKCNKDFLWLFSEYWLLTLVAKAIYD